MIDNADWTFPVPVRFGPGRIAELGAVCSSVGSTNPLVVTDRGSTDLPFIGEALRSLEQAGLRADIFSDISPNPTDADVAKGRAAFRSGSHDGVIAIGGGSGMDAGKAISLVAANELDIWRFDYDLGPSSVLDGGGDVVAGGGQGASAGFPPLITIPTTAGTGAETESTAMVTDLAQGIKRCIWHEDHKPAATILDPELTLGLPANLTAWTGIDALIHAIEAYSVPDWHPMCDGLALEAIRLIWRSLPDAVADGQNLEARSAMLVGSCLAGVSFLKGLGLVHAMSHMIGAVYDTHHGLTNAVLLPSVLRFNRDAIEGKTNPMTDSMGLEPGFDRFYGSVTSLLDQLEIPVGLVALGVGPDRVSELATKALGDAAAGTNPRQATVAELETMLEASLTSCR